MYIRGLWLMRRCAWRKDALKLRSHTQVTLTAATPQPSLATAPPPATSDLTRPPSCFPVFSQM